VDYDLPIQSSSIINPPVSKHFQSLLNTHTFVHQQVSNIWLFISIQAAVHHHHTQHHIIFVTHTHSIIQHTGFQQSFSAHTALSILRANNLRLCQARQVWQGTHFIKHSQSN